MKFTIGAISLKKVEKSDARDLHFIRTHPVVNKFIKRETNKSISDIEEFIKEINSDPTKIFLTIKISANSDFAGTIGLKNINFDKKYAEVGYELLPEFQGKGIMSCALKEIINFAFTDLEIENLEAFTHKENIKSIRLLEKFNFRLIENKFDNNNPNNVIYGLRKPS